MLRTLKQGKIVIALVTVFFVFGVLYWYFRSDPCATPLTYKIGTVDEQFGVTKDELLLALFRAEEVWEDPTYLNLLEYRSDGELAINFVFDDRQEETIREQQSRAELEGIRNEVDYNQQRYDELKTELEVLQKQYKTQETQYHAREGAFLLNIERSDGSKKTVEALQQEEQKLKELYDELEMRRLELNQKVEFFNSLVGSYESVVSAYNLNVDDYNNQFAGVREFDQGDYTTDGRISIYQYDNQEDLVLVLAHEFGHALGLGHVLDPEAIMYFQLVEQERENPMLQSADIIELQAHCELVQL